MKLVETYAKHTGLWADSLQTAEYERVLHVRPVERRAQHGRPVESACARGDERPRGQGHRRRVAGRSPGKMPDGAVIIAAITSCTNTSNPRNVIAAGLLARNANRLGLMRKPWVKSSLAPGSKAVALYLDEAGLTAGARAARLRRRRVRLHHLQRHVGRARSEDPAGDHRARPVCDRGALGQPQLRRPHPPVREAGVPRLAGAGGGLRHRRHDPLRHREGCVRHRCGRQADPAQGPVADGCGDRCHRRGRA